MRLGGWWRLWIGLSVLWAASALAFAFFAVERPTPASVARSVGVVSCDLDFPVPPELAGRVLKIPAQLEKISALDGEANDAVSKPISKAVRGTVEALAAHAGKTVGGVTDHAGKAEDYYVDLLRDPQGVSHIFVAPSYFSDAQIYEQIDKGRGSLNSWNKFQSYCVEQLKSQARNDLYPAKLKEWALGTAVGALSFPLLSLILGAFIGWVWRGFRHRNA